MRDFIYFIKQIFKHFQLSTDIQIQYRKDLFRIKFMFTVYKGSLDEYFKFVEI